MDAQIHACTDCSELLDRWAVPYASCVGLLPWLGSWRRGPAGIWNGALEHHRTCDSKKHDL